MGTTPDPWNPDWHCEAYGPELDALEPAGAPHCFMENFGTCWNADECHTRLMVERLTVFARLLVGAQNGDEMSIMLLEDIGHDPRKLLRATEED